MPETQTICAEGLMLCCGEGGDACHGYVPWQAQGTILLPVSFISRTLHRPNCKAHRLLLTLRGMWCCFLRSRCQATRPHRSGVRACLAKGADWRQHRHVAKQRPRAASRPGTTKSKRLISPGGNRHVCVAQHSLQIPLRHLSTCLHESLPKSAEPRSVS